MEKLKVSKEMVYKKGLAVVVDRIEKINGEYHPISSKMELRLYFKSKNAINNVSKILGHKLNKKQALNDFEIGRKFARVIIDDNDEYMLSSVFAYKEHIDRNGYIYSHRDEYCDSSLCERVNPGNLFKGISERNLDMYLGPTADVEGTFREYLESIVEKINKGTVIYCPFIY